MWDRVGSLSMSMPRQVSMSDADDEFEVVAGADARQVSMLDADDEFEVVEAGADAATDVDVGC